MTHNWHPFAVLLLFGSALALSAKGQDEDPFRGAPADAPATKEKSAPKPAERTAEVGPREHPIVIQLRKSEPQTLDQLTRALRITMQLSAIAEFNRYADAWLALKPNDANLAALHRKYGGGMFFEMTRRRDLQPNGARVAETVLSGADRYTRDPARLRELGTKLSAPEESARLAALRGLREAGSAGIVSLISALADDTFKADRAAIRQGLLDLGQASSEPLISALSAPSAEVRADAATVLGQLKARDAMQYLVGLAASTNDSPDRTAAREAFRRLGRTAPTALQAKAYLADRIRSLLAGELPAKLNENDQVALWSWDAKTNAPRQQLFPPDQASLVVADRFAQQLIPLAKDDRALTRLALIARLEADQTFAGLDNPLPQGNDTAWALAKSLGDDTVEASLLDALALDRATAIAALVEVLGDSGRPELLTREPGIESPLIKALSYPDRRAQVAALKAILALDPATAFTGSSRVVETMKFLLSSSGQPRVLVGHPQQDEARRIATLYAELGYESDSATTGSGLIRQAVANSDYELILISETLADLSDAIQALRKDSRTARIPVGVMSQYVILEPRYVPEPLKEAGQVAFLRSVFSVNADRQAAVDAYQIVSRASEASRLTLTDLTSGVPDLLPSATKLDLQVADLVAIAVVISEETGRQTFSSLQALLEAMAASRQFQGRGLDAFQDLAALSDADRARVLGNSQARSDAYVAIVDSIESIRARATRYAALGEGADADRWRLGIPEQVLTNLTAITEEEVRARRVEEDRFKAVRLPGSRAEKAVDKVQLATVVPTPYAPEALNYTHSQVMKLAPTRYVAPELRLEQAYFVLEQVGELLARERPPLYYDLVNLEASVETAAINDVLAKPALRVLGLLGTPKAQLALVEQASIRSALLENRRLAAKELHKAILLRGLFLTQAQIQKQYDLYSSEQDPGSREILRYVLDAIEEPTAHDRAAKLKLLPKPTASQ